MNFIQRKLFLNKNILKRYLGTINFGILFDIDGVLIHGSQGIDGAKKMFQIMLNSFESKIPIGFLTNSCDSPETKASILNNIFNINVDNKQIIHAPAPLRLFTDIHQKRTFFVGQGNIQNTAKDLQFTNIIELCDIQRAYPTLDVMEKTRRRALRNGYVESRMDPIEAVVIFGEPTDWQSYLQIMTDLLVTHGDLSGPIDMSCQRLPIYLCNLDFLYKAECNMLRYGNGAFVHCLEMLYKKYTGLDLKYTAVIGKPGEISFRYAEHVLNSLNRQINDGVPLERIYMIGDNPCSDIMGANLYQHFIDHTRDLPSYRSLPISINVYGQSAKSIKSFLVKTGVYNEETIYDTRQQHWTFSDIDSAYLRPTMIVEDCLEAFYRILEIEAIQSASGN